MLGLGLKKRATPPKPIVTSIDVPVGTAAGGESFTIKGKGFTVSAPVVKFGIASATSVVVTDDQTLTCASPANAASAIAYDVSVTTVAGTGTLSAAFFAIPDYVDFFWPEKGITLASGNISQWAGRKNVLTALQSGPTKQWGYAAGYNGTAYHSAVTSQTTLMGIGAIQYTQASPYSTTIVGNCQAGNTEQIWIDGGTSVGDSNGFTVNGFGANESNLNAGSSFGSNEAATGIYSPCVLSMVWNGASSAFYVNNTKFAQNLTTSVVRNGITLGNYFSGEVNGPIGNIAAIVVRNGAMSDADAAIDHAAFSSAKVFNLP